MTPFPTYPATTLDTDASEGMTAVIAQLVIYPIKSCAGVSVQQAELTDTGLALDRNWMVVDAQGEFLTQRELPRMALIQPVLKTYDMILRAPGMLALHVALDAVESAVTVQLWGEALAAFDMGAVAAQWMSDFLGVTARLVRFDPDHRRISDKAWTGSTEAFSQFTDGFAALVLSQPSLDGLNSRLVAGGHAAVSMARFRPNIVLASVPGKAELLAHDEDRIDELCLDAAGAPPLLRLVKPCPRCPIPNVDPLTGVVTPVVAEVLRGYRADARLGGAVSFGMNAIVGGDAGAIAASPPPVLSVGQRVRGRYRFD